MPENENSIPIALNDALGFNIYRVALLFRRELMRALHEYNMTPEQWQVMVTLWSGKELNQTEIVRLTLKDNPTVSRMVQRLDNNGWVEKRVSPDDSRVTFIRPTKKGWKLKDEIPAKVMAHFQPIFDKIGEKKEEILLEHLKDLREILGD